MIVCVRAHSVSVPENPGEYLERFLEKDSLSEFGSEVIDKAHCPGQGAKRLQEAIDYYVAIAKTADQDFDRALRGAYVALGLMAGDEE